MRRVLIALLLVTGATSAPRVGPSGASLSRVVANDNRTPAGTLRNGVLTIELAVVMARWYPEAADGPFVDLPVFAAEGKAPAWRRGGP